MPPSTRRRVQQRDVPPLGDDDTDSETDARNFELAIESHLEHQQQYELRRQQQQQPDHQEDLDSELADGTLQEGEILEEDEEFDDEALASPNGANAPLPNLEPPPSYLREISTLASWTVSSSKPGCSIPQLRHPSTNLFWQSDGPQPHYLNIHFFKLVRIVGLRLYLDFEQDESYTPTRIIFLAGSGMNDLQEWGEMRLESPRGWVWADFSGVGDADDSDSDDETDGDGDERMRDAAGPVRPEPQEGSSDSENNNPNHTQRTPAQADILSTPQQHPHQQMNGAHTGTHHHVYATPTDLRNAHLALTTPSLPRPSPRQPFTALSQIPPAPRPQHQRRPKLPVLRAHLVQIKILENHQNGKDTHLRGLQIFARNDETEFGRRAAREPARRAHGTRAAGPGGGGGASTELVVRGAARRERRAERFELGGFDEGTIR